jgi:L-2-hydroxyglutarate oxidase
MDDHTIIIGAGIVGLATAWEIVQKKPNAKITILEKEREVAFHQTGHNSGVLHTGIYYKPNSLKALNCRSGKLLMEKFCAEYEIPHEICGKVIVATKQSEIPSLNKIYQRGLANGVACEKIDRAQLLKIEPHCAGIEAIHVPEAGIVNYKEVCNKLISLILEKEQNEIYYHSKVVKIRTHNKQVVVETNNKDFTAQRLINCGGLYSDHLTQLSGQKVQAKIIPFRGEYFEVKANAKDLCRNLIYPVP